MKLPKKILVAAALGGDLHAEVKASEMDKLVTARALELAHCSGGQLHLLHVGDWEHEGFDQHLIEELKTERQEALKVLARMAQEQNPGEVHYTTNVMFGRPWHTILSEAEYSHADLIVIGPQVHPVNVLNRLIHGSTAGRLMRKSKTPILRIAGPGPHKKIERILVAVDFTAVSAELIELARQMREACGAKLTLFHGLQHPHDFVMHRKADPEVALKAYHQEVREQAEKKLDELLGADRKNWDIILDEDWVGRVVPRIVQEKQIDLLLLAITSQPRLAGVLMGTTAEKILDHTDVSAYMIQPPE